MPGSGCASNCLFVGEYCEFVVTMISSIVTLMGITSPSKIEMKEQNECVECVVGSIYSVVYLKFVK